MVTLGTIRPRWLTRPTSRGMTLVACLLLTVGCSFGPRRIRPPRIDPEAAADEAIALYDANNDGSLDADELRKCSGVLRRLGAYDLDQDGQVSRDEMAARIAARCEKRIGLTSVQAHFFFDGEPLRNAQITFEPEPFLGDELKTAVGTTNLGGGAVIAIPDAELPDAQQGLNALHVGTYKVRVTHPEIEIPSRYNSETVLGHETVSGELAVRFDLKSSK